MKNLWWVAGLTLALCPLGVAAQGDGTARAASHALAASYAAPSTDDAEGDVSPDFSPGDEIPPLGWVNLLGIDFRGNSSDSVLRSNNDGAVWCATGSDVYALGHLRVPHGATITHLRLWGWDGSPSANLSATLYRSCLPDLGPDDATITPLGSTGSSGAPNGFTSVTTLSPPVVVDEHTCTYFVELDFGACDDAGYLAAAKVRVQYNK